MALISVIVPVYKVEKYLGRCLMSILAQTFSDFEVILIDDGSPDSSPLICDEYAEKDGRVKVIHQPNSGPSAARNAGIAMAFENEQSKYLAFIDSDDCVHPQYFEFLLKAMEESDADISVCRHDYIMHDKPLNSLIYDHPTVMLTDAENLLLTQTDSFNYVWGKLFGKKCFEDLRFPEGVSFGEDNLIIYKAFFKASIISQISEKLYYYYYNPTGITKSPWNPSNLQCFKGIVEQMNYYLENNYQKAYKKEVELYIQQCAYQISRIRDDKKNLRKNKVYLRQLQKNMTAMLKEHPEFHSTDRFIWFEALHPVSSYMIKKAKGLTRRVKRKLCKIHHSRSVI